MKTCSCCALLSLSLGLGGVLPAQTPTALVIKRQLPVGNEKATDFVLPIVTDGEGNIYARYGDRWGGSEVITKISPSGRKELSFNIPSVPGLSDAAIGSFCVSDEKLVVLARKGVGRSAVGRLVVFDPNGTLLSNVRIESDIGAGQIAAWGSGKVIVVGRAYGVPGSVDSIPKAGIIDMGGHVVADVRLEGDITPAKAETRATTNGGLKRDIDFETALVASVVTSGDDDNVYVMRYGTSGLVFVVSSTGTVIHRFSHAVPPRSSLKQIKVAKHRIAAVFLRWKLVESEVDSTIVRTYDANSGTRLSDSILDPTVPSLMASYDGAEGFTFVGPMSVDSQDPAQAERLRIFEVAQR